MEQPSWTTAVMSVPPKVWARAAKEVAAISGISLIPLAFKFLVRFFKGEHGNPLGAVEALISVLREGELLFVTIGIVATVVWLSNQDFGRSSFEGRVWFTILSIIGIAISVFFIGFNPEFNTIPDRYTTTVSIVTFIVFVCLYVIITVLTKFNESDYTDRLRAGENRMEKRMEGLHK